MKKFKNPYLQHEYNLNEGAREPKNPYLQHGWGKTAEQKQKEREYNRKYYEQHKRDKWGVGDHLKAFGSSVKETMQKHNENWQSGMDTILRKNYAQTPTAPNVSSKKKRNSAKAMATNEAEKAMASRKRYEQISKNQHRKEIGMPEFRRQNAALANEISRQDAAKAAYDKTKRKMNASSSRANAYAENEMSRRANQQPSEVIRNVQRSKEGQRMHDEVERRLFEQYGRDAYNKEMQKAAKDKQMDQYRMDYLNTKNTKEKQANESYAQANSANRNRMAKLDKQISDLQKERDSIEYYYNAHGDTGKTVKTEEARRATYKQDQADRERMSAIDQELKKLNAKRDALVDRHNSVVSTANTYDASRDTTKEKFEKNSKEHAAVTKKISDYNNKIAKASSQYEEAKQHVTAMKNNKNSGYYANGDVWANHKMRWEDNMSKAADELDALVKQRDALKKKQKELEEALR